MDRAKTRARPAHMPTQNETTHVIGRWTEELVERTRSAAPGSSAREERGESPELAAVPERGLEARVTRAVNFVLAALALFVALPLLLLIAFAIKLSSRGPVLYTQERVGLDRRIPDVNAGNHRRTRDLG